MTQVRFIPECRIGSTLKNQCDTPHQQKNIMGSEKASDKIPIFIHDYSSQQAGKGASLS